MMRVRTSSGVEHLAAGDGRTVALGSRTWQFAVRAGRVGLAWEYRHPTGLELTAAPAGRVSRARVFDHVMVVRAAAALLVLAASLNRRRHP